MLPTYPIYFFFSPFRMVGSKQNFPPTCTSSILSSLAQRITPDVRPSDARRGRTCRRCCKHTHHYACVALSAGSGAAAWGVTTFGEGLFCLGFSFRFDTPRKPRHDVLLPSDTQLCMTFLQIRPHLYTPASSKNSRATMLLPSVSILC